MEDLASNDVDFDQGEQISGWTEIAAHRNLANCYLDFLHKMACLFKIFRSINSFFGF